MNLSSPTQEDFIFGGLFVGLSLISVIPNVFFILVVFSNEGLRKIPSYEYMVALSYLNIGMLIFNLITGFYTMFQTVVHPLLNKLVGAVGMPLYTAYVLLSMILAFNCFMTFLKLGSTQTWFEPKHAKKWYILPLFGFSIVFLCYASPWAGIIYFPDQYSWNPDPNANFSTQAYQFEQYIELSGMLITGILYVLLFVMLIKLKYKYSATQNSIQEWRILAQTFLIALVNIILNFFWYNSNLILPPIKEAYSFNIFGGIFNCVINPITYIIINNSIRRNIGIPTKENQNRLANVKKFLATKVKSTSRIITRRM